MAKQSAIVGAHRLRRTQPYLLHRFHPGPGIVNDRKGRDQADQRDGGNIARPEPQQKQRCIGETGNWSADAHQRQQNILRSARAAHEHARRNADASSQRKTGGKPHERVQSVMRQNATGREPRQGRANCFQRREKLDREDAEMRHGLPQGAHNDKGIGIAPGAPKVAVAGAGAYEILDDIMHRVVSIMLSLMYRQALRPWRRCSGRALC
jgi:hypothetical protein